MPSLGKLYAEITGDTKGLRDAEGRVSQSFDRMKKTSVAASAAIAGAVTAASLALVVMTQRSLSTVDAQAKFAQSLGTSTKSVQVLHRAADLSGISIGELEIASRQLTRRLSQAAAGAGNAGKYLDKLGLSADELLKMPLDQRMDKVATAIKTLVPASQQAGIMAELFGSKASFAISRLDTDTLRTAADDVTSLGVAMSEVQATAIEEANDSLSRMSMIAQGLGNQIAASVAPALKLMADRYVELAKEGGVLHSMIGRISETAMKLAEILSSEKFINAAATAFTTIMDLAGKAAEAIIFLVENAELSIGIITALGVAALGLSGPFGIIAIGAGAVAGLALAASKVKKPMDDAADSARTAAEVQAELNKALGTFSETAAPSAGNAAVALANENYKLAQSALAAAEAHIEMRRQVAIGALTAAKEAGFDDLGQSVDIEDPNSRVLAEARRQYGLYKSTLAEVQEAEASLEAARRKMLDTDARVVQGTDFSGGGGGTVDFGEDDDDPNSGSAIKGVGSADMVREQMEARLEALQTGLLTEQEFLDEWRQEQLDLLDDALANELLTNEEYADLKERLEQEHQDRMAGIRQMAAQSQLSDALGAGAAVLNAMGSFNKKALKLAKTAAAAQALVSAYQGAAKELEKGTLGFATAAMVLARGISFVAAIKGVSDSGSGGYGRGGGGGGSTASAAPAAPQERRVAEFRFMGGNVLDPRAIVDAMNDAYDQGYQIRGVLG